MQTTLHESVLSFAARCRDSGFDIVHPFSVAGHNATATAGERLGTFGRAAPLGLIVGNTRFFWPVFLEAIDADPALARAVNPVDEYTEARLGFATAALGRSTLVSFVHVTRPHPVPVQRMADAAGLAHLSPSHLSIHPTYGPWLAFRAVIVVDDDEPPLPLPATANPCGPCSKPCLPALGRALESTRDPSVRSLGESWPLWVKIRDACPEGKSHRYGEDQVRYHYAKDRTMLRAPRPRFGR